MRTLEKILDDVIAARRVNDADALLRYADELDEHHTPLAEANALWCHGTVSFQRSDYPAAQEHFTQALVLFEEHDDRVGVARALTGIGAAHSSCDELTMALECFHRALAISIEIGDRAVEASVATNLGLIHFKTGDLSSALEQHYRALAICELLGDRNGIAGATCNIGLALFSIDDYPAALIHFYNTLELSTELGNKRWAAVAYINIGNIFDSTGDYATALEYYTKAVVIFEEIGDKSGIASITTAVGWTHQNCGELDIALEYHHRAFAMHRAIGETQAAANDLCNIILVLLKQHLYDEARPHLEKMDNIEIHDPLLRIWREQCRAGIQEGSGDLDSAVATLQLALTDANEHGVRSKAADIHKDLRDLAQKRNDLAGYIEHNNENTRITNEINGKDTAARLATQAAERRIAIERQEHQKHLAILHSTLPRHIANRVARGETVNDHYDNVAVIFLDIAGFTAISDRIPSGHVVHLLEQIFTTLDAVCERYNVVKIKTIGDSYMAVSFGTANSEERTANSEERTANSEERTANSEERTANTGHIHSAALCALDMIASLDTLVITMPPALGDTSWMKDIGDIKVRIGMHCGPVTAGVIGTQRRQYDVWGDTVNVASRMESTSEPGRIHVSEAFARSLANARDHIRPATEKDDETVIPSDIEEWGSRSQFLVPCSLIERGVLEIKGKGTMQTYWLE